MNEVPARAPFDELAALRTQADLRRAARRRVADAVAEHGASSVDAVALRAELHAVNEQWAELIRQAAGAGHALADVARAAGVAAPSLYYRLRQTSADTVRSRQTIPRPRPVREKCGAVRGVQGGAPAAQRGRTTLRGAGGLA